jgi:hypothetical protein
MVQAAEVVQAEKVVQRVERCREWKTEEQVQYSA